MKRLLILFFLVLTACQSGSVPGVSSELSSLTSLLSSSEIVSSSLPSSEDPLVFDDNVVYGTDERHVLEYAYLPSESPRAMVMLVHGGSWIGGDKSMMRPYRDVLVQQGYLYVSINYRLLLSGATYVDMLNDLGLAIQFIRLNASFFNLDTTQMALFGVSAGAHLSLLYAYSRTSPIPIDYVVALVPPVDFSDPAFLTMGNQELQLFQINSLTGTNVADAEELETNGYPEAWLDASPITYAATAVPSLFAYAGQDELIPSSNLPRLLAELDTFEKPYESLYFPNSGHSLSGDPELIPLLNQKIVTGLSLSLD
jgi:acetyl esterase/lipase